MRIYLNGAEYKSYRKILNDYGVSYACLNYEYIWSRTPRFNLREDCNLFEDLIATSGGLYGYALDDYRDFLNENADMFSFALAPVELDDCEVPIYPHDRYAEYYEYYVTYIDTLNPFAKQKYKESREHGAKIHGVDFDAPYLCSLNSGTWMRGKAGWISEFTKDHKLRVHKATYTVTAFARDLKEKGYDIDLDKVKRMDWKEIAKVNCVAWKKYQDWRENG